MSKKKIFISIGIIIFLSGFAFKVFSFPPYCSQTDTTPPFSWFILSSYQDAKKEILYGGAYTLYYLEDQVNVTLKASDSIDGNYACCSSGVQAIYYRVWKYVNNQWIILFNWTTYSGQAINFCQLGQNYGYGCDGKYELEWYAKDKAGNQEVVRSQDFYVDSNAEYLGMDIDQCDQKDGCYNKYWPGSQGCTGSDYPSNCSYFDYEVYGSSGSTYCGYQTRVTDNDGDGWDIECDCDCDDSNPNIYPGAQEICNDGKDNNCNGLVDYDDHDFCCSLNRTGDYTLNYQCILEANTTHHLSRGNLYIVEGGSIIMMSNSKFQFDNGYRIELSGSNSYILKSESGTKIEKITQ